MRVRFDLSEPALVGSFFGRSPFSESASSAPHRKQLAGAEHGGSIPSAELQRTVYSITASPRSDVDFSQKLMDPMSRKAISSVPKLAKPGTIRKTRTRTAAKRALQRRSDRTAWLTMQSAAN